MSHEIRLITMGSCFLCLQPGPHNWREKDEPGGSLYSLQSLCRHLEISVDKIIGSASTNKCSGGRRGGHGDMSSLVSLCGRCGRSYMKFMDFFHTKELIEMELEHLLRSMKGWMVGTTEMRGFKRLMSVHSRDRDQLKNVEELRGRIIQQSALKLSQTKPAVKLIKLEKGSLSEPTANLKLPTTDTPPPPTLEDSTKCNAKLTEDEEHYDDDNDDIPIPILEIVKLEQPDDVRAEPSQHDEDGEVMIEDNTDQVLPGSLVEPYHSVDDMINDKELPVSTEDVPIIMEAEADNETDPLWEPDIPSNDLNSDNDDDEIWEPNKSSRAPKRRFPASQKNNFIRLSGGKVRCKLCHRTFSKKPGWQIHYDSVHLGRRYKCSICSSSFTQHGSMTKHRKFCDGRRRTPSPVPVASGSGVILKEKARADKGKIGVFTKYYFINEAGKAVCSLCQNEYADSSGFYSHFRVSHINIRSQCKDCGKTFTQNCTLTKHKETCLGKPRRAPDYKYLCKRCGKGFTTPAWLKEHEEKVHLGIKYSCDVCMKSYSYKHCLQRHACTGPPNSSSNGSTSNSVAATVDRFDCKFCGKKFPSYVHYRVHARKTFMKVQQRCMVCVTTFSRDCGLELHNKGKCEGEARPYDPDEGNIYECLECEYKFTSKGGLVTHRESVHQGAVFRCDLCNKPFTNMPNVRRHRLTCLSHPSSKTGIAPLHPDQQPFKPRRRMRKADGTYECDHCKEKFDSAAKLTFHIQNVHLGLEFECGKCKKTFSRKGGLQLHQKRHCPYLKAGSSRSKMNCDEIEEPTSSYASYCHKGRRVGEVICNLCKRSFASKVGFRIHYQYIHQGLPHQYRCQICSKTFTKKADLAEHEKEDKCCGANDQLEEHDDGQQRK